MFLSFNESEFASNISLHFFYLQSDYKEIKTEHLIWFGHNVHSAFEDQQS